MFFGYCPAIDLFFPYVKISTVTVLLNFANYYPLLLKIRNLIIENHSIYWRHRLVVRTPGFHPGNRGPIPLGATE